jgi:alkanesulfonate monooxygenase SsuD/methylene tetrahydromethanopterin reductase-like flavin-dependent oxidoreductase (luciferase family)
MAISHSIFLPMGFGGPPPAADPSEAYAALVAIARTAERCGFETAWVLDHLLPIPPSPAPVFECWALVTALLGETRRLRVGNLVTAAAYRHPFLQAKIAGTTDVISGGRLTFGIGAGWYEPDFAALGLELPAAPERLRRLDAALHTIRRALTDGSMAPSGVQLPHIPIMGAGGGEKVTLKLVARHADACNMLAGPDVLARKYAVIDAHCEALGRDPSEIRRTALTTCLIADTDAAAQAAFPDAGAALFDGDVRAYGLIGAPDTIRERIDAYAAAGVDELIVGFAMPDIPAAIERYAEIAVAGGITVR